jgi:tRNA threonylcarbamoyladenosine biosynthesis protein TsaE
MQKYVLNEIKKIKIPLNKPKIIFLKGDLWAWKTTLSKYIIWDLLKVTDEITSPTYTYYNKYRWILNWEELDIYHFDLYRLENYDEFFAIWWEEILDNNSWIILIEWPDILTKYYDPDLLIEIFKTEIDEERKIKITSLN